MFKPTPENPKLDEAIDSLFEELKVMNGDAPEYAKTADQLKKLYEIKENIKPDRVKPDTLALVCGNVAIAVLIIGFEQKNVVTTKVLGFLSKLR